MSITLLAVPWTHTMRLQRFAFIKQEHRIFSAYATASFSGTIVSSLVPGDEFIHSYDVGIRDKESFLALRTYSSRGKACYQNTFVGCHDVVGKTRDYLTVSYIIHISLTLTYILLDG